MVLFVVFFDVENMMWVYFLGFVRLMSVLVVFFVC